MCAKLPTGRLQIVPSEKLNLPQKKITCNIYIYTSNLVTVHNIFPVFCFYPGQLLGLISVGKSSTKTLKIMKSC